MFKICSIIIIGIFILSGCTQQKEQLDQAQIAESTSDQKIPKKEIDFDQYRVPPLQTNDIKISDVFVEKIEDGWSTYLKMENLMGDSLGLNTMDSSILILTTDKGSYQASLPRKVLKSHETLITTIPFPKAHGTPLSLVLKGLIPSNKDGIGYPGTEPLSVVISLQPKDEPSNKMMEK